ncbi:MAG: HNH endonuclease, partial [Chamaesiphon sp.]|nr:HNH endonuclease [Chamaesiphon sp.]
LRVFARHEGVAPADPAIAAELRIVQSETRTSVDLARTPERNIIRNSGQYWKGTGLLVKQPGKISLTSFGRSVAEGYITQGEFAAIIVQQTVLPNPWTNSPEEIAKWKAANLEIRPLQLILEIIEILGRDNAESSYLTNNELMRVVIPLAGIKATSIDIAQKVFLFRDKKLDVSSWPDCVPAANDHRLAREFLLFLANFGLLQLTADGSNEEQRFYLKELFDVKSAIIPVDASIFDASAEQAVDEVRHSPLPSIIERQRTLTNVLRRSGQAQFRAKIVKAYNGSCLLTQETISDVLEAAHIVPVSHGGSDDDNNGFCLRVDIHRLFDSGNIRIKPTGELLLSEIAAASRNYSLLPNKIAIPSFVNPANVAWREKYC